MGNRYAGHVTPLYPQKLALTLPTGGGRSVGIVRSRTKATEFSFSLACLFNSQYILKARHLSLRSIHGESVKFLTIICAGNLDEESL